MPATFLFLKNVDGYFKQFPATNTGHGNRG